MARGHPDPSPLRSQASVGYILCPWRELYSFWYDRSSKSCCFGAENREWDGFGRMWCEAWCWWQPGLRPAERRGCVLPLPVLAVSAWLHAAFLSCPPLFSLLRSCPGFYSSLANSLLEFPPPGEYKCDYWADVLPSRCPLQLPLSPLLILNLPQPF